MTVTATEFRKNLFSLLEHVLHGETLEVRYKGSLVRIAPASSGSKLARAKRQKTLLCDPDEIVHTDRKLAARMESAWNKDWSRI
jgi:antitoxin (DNA-binding transcriptional repressor) of toxin-antitoxin stability system